MGIHVWTMYIHFIHQNVCVYNMYIHVHKYSSETLPWRQYRQFVPDVSICRYRHHETSISTFWFMTSISGTICNFDIESLSINIVIEVHRYWRTPILKIRWYQRFVLLYRRIPISKKRWYRNFYFDIWVRRHRRFFDIKGQKHIQISKFFALISKMLQYWTHSISTFWLILSGPARVTINAGCIPVLDTECSV